MLLLKSATAPITIALTKYIILLEHHDIYNQKEADTSATTVITFLL